MKTPVSTRNSLLTEKTDQHYSTATARTPTPDRHLLNSHTSPAQKVIDAHSDEPLDLPLSDNSAKPISLPDAVKVEHASSGPPKSNLLRPPTSPRNMDSSSSVPERTDLLSRNQAPFDSFEDEKLVTSGTWVKTGRTFASMGVGLGVSGEIVHFDGTQEKTGKHVRIWAAGINGDAGFSLPGAPQAGSGIFHYAGPLKAIGGLSASVQMSAGITGSVSVNIDGSGGMAQYGGETSIGANIGLSYAAIVEVDGEIIYAFGTGRKFERAFFDGELDAMRYSLANSPAGKVEIHLTNPDGFTMVQQHQRVPHPSGGFQINVKEYLLGKDGRRVNSKTEKAYTSEPWHYYVSEQEMRAIPRKSQSFKPIEFGRLQKLLFPAFNER